MIVYAVDDEPILLKTLNSAIEKAIPGVELYSFLRATPLLTAIKTGTPMPDVAFLDIELPGMGGIELAKQIKLLSPKTWIVFVTGFSQYAVEAYQIHAKGYVMKPVSAERIKEELNAPCEVSLKRKDNALLRAKCFGNFEVFAGDEPIRFERSKTKELLAYLIDRNGAAVNTGTLCAVLWENQPDSEAQRNYFRKLVADLSKTLDAVGAKSVFLKNRNSFAIDPSKIDCDFHRFLKREPDAVNAYTGEYMTQYSWSELTLAGIQ